MTLKVLFAAALAASPALAAAPEIVALPGKSPLVTFRFVFRTGSAQDPTGQFGLAALTAKMVAEGGSKSKTYKQILDAMYPMATSLDSQTDKEMIAFSGVTHIDNLDAYYGLVREMLLEPGWRQEDLDRLRDDQINYLRVTLRGNNDEELGKEVLYNRIFEGHPYGHHNRGTVSSLRKMTLEDLQRFYKQYFTQSNLVIGLGGGYPEAFLDRVKKDFAKLPEGDSGRIKITPVKPVKGRRMTMIEKETRSVAYSLGFPIRVRRGDPDFPALMLATSYLGQHRDSGGLLYNQMREARGLNYGDYAYIEYFPNGMFQFEPSPNLGRQQQIFQIWIRPVDPATAHFTLRLALFEFERFVRDGLSQEAFEKSRSFLMKHVNLLTKTKSAELGYAIDSRYYGIPDYNSYIKSSLAKLTREDVNRAIRKHLQAENMDIVMVAKNTSEWKKKFLSEEASPISYNSPKPEALLAEDKIVATWKLALKPERIEIVPVERVFE